MESLSLDKLLAAGKESSRKVKEVPVPEFGDGVVVHVRKMPARERDAYDSSLYTEDGKLNKESWRAKHVACVLCQPDGTPLFDPAKLDESAKLIGDWDSEVVIRIYSASTRFNNLDAGEAAKGKADSGEEAAGSSSSGSLSSADAPTLTPGSTASPPE